MIWQSVSLFRRGNPQPGGFVGVPLVGTLPLPWFPPSTAYASLAAGRMLHRQYGCVSSTGTGQALIS